jgi:hypothetical protein
VEVLLATTRCEGNNSNDIHNQILLGRKQNTEYKFSEGDNSLLQTQDKGVVAVKIDADETNKNAAGVGEKDGKTTSQPVMSGGDGGLTIDGEVQVPVR